MREQEIATTIELTPEHPCFVGHFPGNPIFPAVAQVGLVVATIEATCGRALVVREVCQGKFLRKIVPPTRLDLRIQLAHDSATWTLAEAADVCSKGRLILEFLTSGT